MFLACCTHIQIGFVCFSFFFTPAPMNEENGKTWNDGIACVCVCVFVNACGVFSLFVWFSHRRCSSDRSREWTIRVAVCKSSFVCVLYTQVPSVYWCEYFNNIHVCLLLEWLILHWCCFDNRVCVCVCNSAVCNCVVCWFSFGSINSLPARKLLFVCCLCVRCILSFMLSCNLSFSLCLQSISIQTLNDSLQHQ